MECLLQEGVLGDWQRLCGALGLPNHLPSKAPLRQLPHPYSDSLKPAKQVADGLHQHMQEQALSNTNINIV